MTTIIPLEIRYKENGPAIKSNSTLLLGDYDVSKGDVKTFYLFNPNDFIQADISQLETINDNSVFNFESDTIAPKDSVRVSIKYIAQPNLEKLTVQELKPDDLPSDFDKLEGKYSLDDAISELPYLCQERFGHGSEATIRRYLKQLTSKVSEWQVIKDDKNKKWICKREVLN